MKKVLLILMLGVFTFGSSGFSSSIDNQEFEASTSCFDFAHALVEAEDGDVNLSNIDRVRFYTFVCEFYGMDIIYP